MKKKVNFEMDAFVLKGILNGGKGMPVKKKSESCEMITLLEETRQENVLLNFLLHFCHSWQYSLVGSRDIVGEVMMM